MTDIHPYFLSASSRRRADLNQLFDECAVIRHLHQTILDLKEWPQLVKAIWSREGGGSFLANPHTVVVANDVGEKAGLHETAGKVWRRSFLSVLGAYAKETFAYADVLQKFEDFKSQHVARSLLATLPYDLFDRLEKQQGPVERVLKDLERFGLHPALMGEIEAHWQVRRIAQLYFSLYSSETNMTASTLRSNRADTSLPDLVYFSRRHNKRSRLMRGVESRKMNLSEVDEMIFLVHYLDRLDGAPVPLRAWHDHARQLYEQKFLVMRGFFGVRDYLGYVADRFGSPQRALRRISKDAYTLYFDLSAQEKMDAAFEHQTQLSLIRSSVESSLCLARATEEGIKYAGIYNGIGRTLPSLLAVLNLDIPRDIFQAHELNFELASVREAWRLNKHQVTDAKLHVDPIALVGKKRKSSPSITNPVAIEQERLRLERLAQNRKQRALARQHAELLSPAQLMRIAAENQRKLDEARALSQQQKAEKAKKSLKIAHKQATEPKRRKPIKNRRVAKEKGQPFDP